MEDLDETEKKLAIRAKKLKKLVWIPSEKLHKSRPKFRSKVLQGYEVPISKAILVKFKRSCFGTYLDSLNCKQQQDKFLNENKLDITKWNIKDLSPAEVEIFRENNNMVDDLFSLLVKAVKETDCITWNFLYSNILALRITDCHVTVLDNELLHFRNLKVLVISNNWISEILGEYLPRALEFFEVYANVVSSLQGFCKNPPEGLLHIGLGRNNLTNESEFALLEKCGRFKVLRTLDLSDNDIYNLKDVLEELKGLESLKALLLKGNPCATCIAYKDAILIALPQLIYLDKVEILDEDRIINNKVSEENLTSAALTFTCHRIMGLPAPPKAKGIIQTIHLEVTLPLLEEIIIGPDDLKKEKSLTNKSKSAISYQSKPLIRKTDNATQKTPSSKGDKSSKQGNKTPSPYDAEDEHENEIKSKFKHQPFKTDRKAWAKILEFPKDSVIVESPENDLKMIRDTFRTNVNVKVVYLAVQPPQKPKIGKNKGTNKKDKDKGKKGEKGAKPTKSTSKVEIEEPKETIIKKVTLANFYCDLRDVNWSEETIDFYWAAHPKSNPKAIPVEGSLKSIHYVEGKGGKKEPKLIKSKENAATSSSKTEHNLPKVPSKEFTPNIFTCQVGFGLKRSFPVS